MSLVVGQCINDPVTGATGRAFNELLSNPDTGLLPEAFVSGTLPRKLLGLVIQAIVKGVVDELTNNGQVQIVVNQAGLQRVPISLSPTLAPTTPQTLSGGIT
jgi:hypothetical protein